MPVIQAPTISTDAPAELNTNNSGSITGINPSTIDPKLVTQEKDKEEDKTPKPTGNAVVSAIGNAAIGIAKGVASGLAQDKANAQKREEAINKQIAQSKALEQKQLSAKLPNISISTTGYGKTPPVSSLPLNQVTPELEDGGLLYSQEEMDKYLQ